MLLPDAIKKARQDLGLSQKRLAELAGIQRKQLATLEGGGNITLATLRKILVHLPNLESFTLDAVTANVMREVPSEGQRKVVDAAIEQLAEAIRGLAGKFQSGQLPDQNDLQAFQAAQATWQKDVGKQEEEDAQLRQFREDSERALALQFAAYRGGAKLAFDAIVALDLERREARRKRLARVQRVIRPRGSLRRTSGT